MLIYTLYTKGVESQDLFECGCSCFEVLLAEVWLEDDFKIGNVCFQSAIKCG